MSAGRLLRLVPTAAIIAGSGLFVSNSGSALAEAAARAHHLSVVMLLVGAVVSCAAMLNRGEGARASHRAVGLDVPRWSMVRPTLAGFAADKIVRAGGLSGTAILLRHGARVGYTPGAVWASTVVTKVASFASLGVFLGGSVLTLAIHGRLTTWWLAAAVGIVVYALFVGVVGVVVARNRRLATRCWAAIRRRFPRFSQSLGGDDPVATIGAGLRSARSSHRLVRRVAAHAVLGKAFGAVLLLIACHSAGVSIGVGTALVIYSTVLVASFASITPGGVGVVEMSAVALLVGTGADVADAFLVVAVFRVLDIWLPLVVGAVALWTARHHGRLHATTAADRAPRRDLAVRRLVGPTATPASCAASDARARSCPTVDANVDVSTRPCRSVSAFGGRPVHFTRRTNVERRPSCRSQAPLR